MHDLHYRCAEEENSLIQPQIDAITMLKRSHITSQLKHILGDDVEIIAYSLEEGIDTHINCDLILVPGHEIVGSIMINCGRSGTRITEKGK